MLRVFIGVCLLSMLAAPAAQGQCRYLQSSFIQSAGYAQAPAMDTLPTRPKWQQPGYTALESAIIPGLGQAVNRQYWKIPIIYAGGATIGYLISYNNRKYQTYRKAYKYRTDSDTATKDNFPLYSDLGILELREAYHSDRDLMVIVGFVAYAANILDAYVYAHLRDFDVSEDLGMQVQPFNLVNIAGNTSYAFTLKLNIR